MEKSEVKFVQFAELRAAASTNSWPKELARVTDWELLSLEQELTLVTLVYDRRNWTMLSKMLGCGVGSDFVELMLRWSCDVSNAAPRTWAEFPVKLFWTQIPRPFCPRAITLDTGALSLLLVVFLTEHEVRENYWDYVPATLNLLLLSSEESDERDADNNTQFQLNNIVGQVFDNIMAMPCAGGEDAGVGKVVQKWRIIHRCVTFFQALAPTLVTCLEQCPHTALEMKVLQRGAHESGNYFAMDVLVQLQNLIPHLEVLLEDIRSRASQNAEDKKW